MSRYDIPGGAESEFEPGSDNQVLRNLEGITDPRVVEERETELLATAYVDSFDWATIGTRFTPEMICEMHRLWLGDIYPTAGAYRTVNMSKGGFLFCAADYVEREIGRFGQEQLAAHTPCRSHVHAPFESAQKREIHRKSKIPEVRPLSVEAVAYKVAVVHAELLLIHPFREGNGRLGRWLADLMVLQSGNPAPEYDLDDDEKRDRYHAAMRQGYKGEFKDLTALFLSWIERGQQLSHGRQKTSR